mmetsp:Transcript_24930/g.68106  ORF Transcript_24930/g.68106 Transcript_24930/m.68106 type:complete len:221 (-) Transcript_24930:372-1034(-)
MRARVCLAVRLRLKRLKLAEDLLDVHRWYDVVDVLRHSRRRRGEIHADHPHLLGLLVAAAHEVAQYQEWPTAVPGRDGCSALEDGLALHELGAGNDAGAELQRRAAQWESDRSDCLAHDLLMLADGQRPQRCVHLLEVLEEGAWIHELYHCEVVVLVDHRHEAIKLLLAHGRELDLDGVRVPHDVRVRHEDGVLLRLRGHAPLLRDELGSEASAHSASLR